MPLPVPPALKPRKTPAQRRARVTVDAIYEATIQVLLRDGMAGLTTTRVAARAGVSVGTLYQYFPHKQALIHALNARYLDLLASRVEDVAAAQAGQPIAQMVGALIDTYWQAKTDRAEVTRALYRSVVELDNEALLQGFAARVDAATTAMLATAPDVSIADAAAVNLTLTSVIYGTVRNAFERGLSPGETDTLRRSLHAMCRAYLETLPQRVP
ncbi:TetR/AcrR family transcriptional regulator [Halodurantibacterium flavum]|uniref:TetR/AcrR family transcriptional regulator n=1 Tax=Halodurantibacterium flavum TaxID=1382802 RepID=A0ABW4S399_9RHOB